MASVTLSSPTESPPGSLHRLSIATYHAMIDHGLLTEGDRVVLLDGLLVTKMAKGPLHLAATRRVFRLLDRRVPEGWVTIKEDSISLPGGPRGDSEPEPDVALLAGREADYDRRLPVADDVALIVEVADSSLAADRAGLSRYAAAAIPAVWLVNLVDLTVEIYTRPSGPGRSPGYEGREIKRAGDALTAYGRGGDVLATIRVDEVFDGLIGPEPA